VWGDAAETVDFVAPTGSSMRVGRGAMKKISTEVVVRGSAAAVGLVALVSVVGAGVKWNA